MWAPLCVFSCGPAYIQYGQRYCRWQRNQASACLCVRASFALFILYAHILANRSVLSLQSIVDWNDQIIESTPTSPRTFTVVPQWCVLKTDEHHLHGRPPDAWSSPRHPMLEIHSSSQWLGKKSNTIAHTQVYSRIIPKCIDLFRYQHLLYNLECSICMYIYTYISSCYASLSNLHWTLILYIYIEYIYFINERLGVQWYVFTIFTIQKQHVQIQWYVYIYTYTESYMKFWVCFVSRP